MFNYKSHRDYCKRLFGGWLKHDMFSDSLESTKSMQPRFPSGTTFLIKYKETPIDGDLVLVRFKTDNTVSLRELIIDSPDWQLNPIISSSKSLLFSHMDHSIIGVVMLTLIQTRGGLS